MAILKKILVTGGAGFIGSNFIRKSLESSPALDFTVLDSLTYAGSYSNLAPVASKINFVKGDVREEHKVRELVSEADLVVHFAAESHNDNSLANPKLFFDTNVMGTINVATACADLGVRLHHVSTDEVFGDLPFDSSQCFDTSSPYNPSSPYSASKAASDHVVRSWTRSFGLRATISNCSNNYGSNQHWEKLIPATIKRFHENLPARLFGDGLNVRDWIHVDDHVSGIWLAVREGELGRTYLFGANDRRTNLEVVSAIAAAMGKSDEDIDFIEDRQGHDRKYAINALGSEELLGWYPEHPSIIEQIPSLVQSYVERLK